jgi:alkyl hydroperoxide reductase subunit AhpC
MYRKASLVGITALGLAIHHNFNHKRWRSWCNEEKNYGNLAWPFDTKVAFIVSLSTVVSYWFLLF